MEPVERAADRRQLWPLRLESLPDRAIGQFGMLVRLGIDDATVEQPGVQLFPRVRARRGRGQAPLAIRSRGVKKRSRTTPTWFSTPAFRGRLWPFSHPEAGVQAVGSTR